MTLLLKDPEAVLIGTQSIFVRECEEPGTVIEAADIATLGTGPSTVTVQQIGERGISRSANIAINL